MGRFSGIRDMFEESDRSDIIAVPGRLFWGPASRCTSSGKILGRSDALDGETCSEGKMLLTLAGVSPALGRALQGLFTCFFLTFFSMKGTFQETSLSYTQRASENLLFSMMLHLLNSVS